MFAMKTLASFLLAFILVCSFTRPANNSNAVFGAWITEKDNLQHVLLFTNKHYSYTRYDLQGKKFQHTEGGTYELKGNKLNTVLEFNSSDKSKVGGKASINIKAGDKEMVSDWPAANTKWTRIDNGGGDLNATWRITGREVDGKMNTIQPSARKTIKIITGNRFQWAAINTSTGEFFGTGGGTYSFKDGRYTEQIEFFSRDDSRVGMSLDFEGKVEGDKWHHRGKSSKGDPIYEIWSKED
jgi:hypothetical protein